ncbi:site-specific DNA-methyltransferase [bacterium]|nr:site-specific DNA-methyltransferase [bacterium]
MSKKYEKLKTLLKELFQLDQPDLDFGLYRIMHAKAAEITQFLDRDLLPQVREEFSQYKTADKSELEAQLTKVIAGLQVAEVDPETSPKVKELREKIASDSVDITGLESEVYDHLYGFFRRYYSEGDFLSKRVYKPGVYAIPYEGEEVKLHWANADQYYIKTSEYLRDYAFRLHPDDEQKPMRVHFRLVDAAEGEHGNVKAAEGKDRIFILASKDFASFEKGEQGPELVLRFEYRPATLTDWPDDVRDGKKKPPTQKEMTELAVSRIMEAGDGFAEWVKELGKPHEKADGELADYSRLRAHLNRYVARNTFDYFIHKDLGGFLRRELDFYIKNEVMHLDDIEDQQAPRVEQYLSKIRVIRRIAIKIITFLAHLEDFQKKLWLKKKFVVETNYCIAIGSIPEEFYPEIAANDTQRQEWVDLLAINEIEKDLTSPGYSEPLTVEFLKAHPTLMIDTQYFSKHFCIRLLNGESDIDSRTDFLLVHSDNFQGVSFLNTRFRSAIQSICVDPPYNTGDDGFNYKDQYQHSSWAAMMLDRFNVAASTLAEEGVAFVNIDDNEYRHLWHVLTGAFGIQNYLGSMVWKRRSASAMSSQPLSLDHEYVLAFGRDARNSQLHGLAKSEEDYPFFDEKTGKRYASTDLTIGMTRDQRPNQFYPIRNPRTGKEFPPNPNRVWRFFPETMEQVIADDLVIWPDEAEGNLERPRYKTYFDPDTMKAKPCSSWIDTANANDREIEEEENEFSLEILRSGMNSEGGRIVDRLFARREFAYPKPLSLIRSLVRASTRDGDIVLDFFAGSGTTGHAIIVLNREDGERRKGILIELGEYFDTVLLPRFKKVTFASDWRDGKPRRSLSEQERTRSPKIIKYIRLESYEDALNNLQLRRSKAQQTLLDAAQNTEASRLKEQYMLGYMLNVETEGSQSLLNVQAFTDPTAYKLKVKRPGSDETREVNVDLLETFNWLIGLTVQHIAAPQCFSAKFERDSEGRLQLKGRLKQEEDGPYWFRTVTGTTPDGRKTLVIWRKRPGGETPEGVEQDNLVLDEWFTKQGYSSKDSEFGLIYVNGTNNLENLRTPEDQWKVRLIEEDFHRLMFAAEGV